MKLSSEADQRETKLEDFEPPEKDSKGEEVQEVTKEKHAPIVKTEVAGEFTETVAPQIYDKLESVPDIVNDLKNNKLTVQSSTVEKGDKEELTITKDNQECTKTEVKRKSSDPPDPEQASATHTGSSSEKSSIRK